MPDRVKDEFQAESATSVGDDLRQALMRLTSPQVEALWNELSLLEQQIDDLRKIEGDTAQLHTLIDTAHATIMNIEERFRLLSDELRDPVMIQKRLGISMLPVLHDQVQTRSDEVAEALAPVMGPAIRHQIRNAKDDIINALYPLIGQIIGKAISEALRELTRNIDSRLRRQLNFRDRFNQIMGRLQGVSEAELVLRDSLPYTIEHIFLIHRETGILLEHLIVQGNDTGEMRTVSGMLTAIQDFVRDSFSEGEGELEDITHGDLRILLENGQYAYVAVVLDGVEPVGYSKQISDVAYDINLQFEKELKDFDGAMASLPDFQPVLGRLQSIEPAMIQDPDFSKPLSNQQKKIIGLSLLGLVLLLVGLIFACIYFIRLWPIVFPL